MDEQLQKDASAHFIHPPADGALTDIKDKNTDAGECQQITSKLALTLEDQQNKWTENVTADKHSGNTSEIGENVILENVHLYSGSEDSQIQREEVVPLKDGEIGNTSMTEHALTSEMEKIACPESRFSESECSKTDGEHRLYTGNENRITDQGTVIQDHHSGGFSHLNEGLEWQSASCETSGSQIDASSNKRPETAESMDATVPPRDITTEQAEEVVAPSKATESGRGVESSTEVKMEPEVDDSNKAFGNRLSEKVTSEHDPSTLVQAAVAQQLEKEAAEAVQQAVAAVKAKLGTGSSDCQGAQQSGSSEQEKSEESGPPASKAPQTRRVTRKPKFTQRVCRLDIDGKAFDQWQKIGAAENLGTHTEIAFFLMEHYENTLAGFQTVAHCLVCDTPLALSCAVCSPSKPQDKLQKQRTPIIPSQPTKSPAREGRSRASKRRLRGQPQQCTAISSVLEEDDGGGCGDDDVRDAGVLENLAEAADRGREARDSDAKATRASLTQGTKRRRTRISTRQQQPKGKQLKRKRQPREKGTQPKAKRQRQQKLEKKQRDKEREKQEGKQEGEEKVAAEQYCSAATFSSPLVEEEEENTEERTLSQGELSDQIMPSSPKQRRGRQPKTNSQVGLKQRHVCQECGATFTRSGGLKVHMRLHTGEKPFSCKLCGKSFNQTVSLIVHMRKHNNERPYVCSECNASFPLASSLKQHARIHTGEKPFKCQECDKAFSRSGDLTSHMRSHTGARPFLCTECGKSFGSSSDLTKHKRTHSGEKPFGCPECGKYFPFPHRLTAHMRSHTGDRPYLCQLCGAAFARASNLTVHTRIHTGHKPFKCEECGKAFSDSGNLCKHRRSNHGGSGKKTKSMKIPVTVYDHSQALFSHQASQMLGVRKVPENVASDTSKNPENMQPADDANLQSIADAAMLSILNKSILPSISHATSGKTVAGLGRETHSAGSDLSNEANSFSKDTSSISRDISNISREGNSISRGVSNMSRNINSISREQTLAASSSAVQFSRGGNPFQSQDGRLKSLPLGVSGEHAHSSSPHFKREECSASFQEPSSLAKHVHTSHTADKSYVPVGSVEQYRQASAPYTDLRGTGEDGAALFPYYNALNYYYQQ